MVNDLVNLQRFFLEADKITTLVGRDGSQEKRMVPKMKFDEPKYLLLSIVKLLYIYVCIYIYTNIPLYTYYINIYIYIISPLLFVKSPTSSIFPRDLPWDLPASEMSQECDAPAESGQDALLECTIKNIFCRILCQKNTS